MVKIFSHQKVIDGYIVITEIVKHGIPLYLMVQDQTSQCVIFLLLQPGLMPFIDTPPVCIFQIKLMDFCHVLRQIIGKFSA